MSDTELETTLCVDCSTPIEKPKATLLLGFRSFIELQEGPRCKDCKAKAREKQAESYFDSLRQIRCPYKLTRKPKGKPDAV